MASSVRSVKVSESNKLEVCIRVIIFVRVCVWVRGGAQVVYSATAVATVTVVCVCVCTVTRAAISLLSV